MTRIVLLNLVLSLVACLVLAAKPYRGFAQAADSQGAEPPSSSKTESAESTAVAASASKEERVTNASLSEFAWLEGNWQGNWGPRIAEQVWVGPRAGEMPGLFRVAENNKTLVLELYSLLETPDGIELRLRHFTPSLVPWESSMTVLKLASIDAKDAVFENTSPGQPSRNTLIRVDADTYISRTEIASDGNKQVTEIRYHRLKSTAEETPSPKKKK